MFFVEVLKRCARNVDASLVRSAAPPSKREYAPVVGSRRKIAFVHLKTRINRKTGKTLNFPLTVHSSLKLATSAREG